MRRQLADALLAARESRVPIPPLSALHPELSLADAYAIAQLGVETDLAAGARPAGHKIGLTSLAVQQQLGVDRPDYGTLLDTMEIAPGATIARADYIAPRIELELAFRLAAPLSGPDVTAADVRAATASVHPAIELVDSRIADWRITLPDTVADRASSAGYVLSESGFALDELDVRSVEVALRRDGEIVETGRSDAVLGDPCEAVAWLANALSALGGSLAAGEIVLSGACTRMLPVGAGERYRGSFGDGLGELELEVER